LRLIRPFFSLVLTFSENMVNECSVPICPSRQTELLVGTAQHTVSLVRLYYIQAFLRIVRVPGAGFCSVDVSPATYRFKPTLGDRAHLRFFLGGSIFSPTCPLLDIFFSSFSHRAFPLFDEIPSFSHFFPRNADVFVPP